LIVVEETLKLTIIVASYRSKRLVKFPIEAGIEPENELLER
jgi:hypothetical protein